MSPLVTLSDIYLFTPACCGYVKQLSGGKGRHLPKRDPRKTGYAVVAFIIFAMTDSHKSENWGKKRVAKKLMLLDFLHAFILSLVIVLFWLNP